MAEINDGHGVKPIAFYLPQYHSIPENDEHWGKGFTEWSNVKKASPLFKGHNQPRVPLNNNYYNLLDDKTKIWQANLAKQYDIFGFCYYHYWFKNGKQLLEKPAEQMLKNKDINIPFCFSWANENWSKNWDGGNREIIVEQDYGSCDDWEKHLEYLIPFFKDERYITLNGNPIFIIYKPELIPDLDKMLTFWNKKIKDFGFNRICFMIQHYGWFFDPSYDPSSFDFQIEFEPHFSVVYQRRNIYFTKMFQKLYQFMNMIFKKGGDSIVKLFNMLKKAKHEVKPISKQLTIYDYSKTWSNILHVKDDPFLLRGCFCDWDNTPRNKNGFVFQGANSKLFKDNFCKLVGHVNPTCPVIFINAWNEWGEGAYLEPDELNRYGYLEAIHEVITKVV